MEINPNYLRYKLSQNKNLTNQTEKADVRKEEHNRKLKNAADGFEEIFVHKLLQVMRSTTPKTDLLSGGHGEEVFRDMLDQNYSKLITKTGALGLSKVIYDSTKMN
ncbi:MAG: hypothetical protein GY786_11805 [Proteobacteria bacterium]|nr:hypothetical protein [Pseudomonadota bacterium]